MINNINYDEIPKCPGCYIFKNKYGTVIYIGKSKSLQNRVRQHFTSTEKAVGKHAAMIREVSCVETIESPTETDALILEYRLIKEHKPRYNKQLKRNQVYPFIRIDVNNKRPSISIADDVADDDSMYIGCFYSHEEAEGVISLLSLIWHTPTCNKNKFASNNKPCLRFHLDKCLAPCSESSDIKHYRKVITEIIDCMNGNFKDTLKRLRHNMRNASEILDFEKAAVLRDSINGLNKLRKKQKRLRANLHIKNCYLFFRAYNELRYSIFFINNGITQKRIDFPDLTKPDPDMIMEFVNNRTNDIYNVDNGEFLTSCLLEVNADKLYLEMPSTFDEVKITNKIASSFKEFMTK